jgi:hypothetical protein
MECLRGKDRVRLPTISESGRDRQRNGERGLGLGFGVI